MPPCHTCRRGSSLRNLYTVFRYAGNYKAIGHYKANTSGIEISLLLKMSQFLPNFIELLKENCLEAETDYFFVRSEYISCPLGVMN